jgi:hypothetical protein
MPCRRRFTKRFFFNYFDMDLHDEMCIENNIFFFKIRMKLGMIILMIV